MSYARFSGIVLASVLLWQTEARADVAPPDLCNGAGQSCSTAPPDYHSPGTCTAKKCTKTLPVGDGAIRTVQYNCTLCVGSAGAGGAQNTGGATSAGTAGVAGDTGSKEDSGCTVSPSHAGSVLSGLMLLAGAVTLLVGRRSRRG